jgi:hypothetical protein
MVGLLVAGGKGIATKAQSHEYEQRKGLAGKKRRRLFAFPANSALSAGKGN